METTIFLSVKLATSLLTLLAGGLPLPRLNPGPSTQNEKELILCYNADAKHLICIKNTSK